MIPVTAYRDRTVLLLGLARSNLAAARALRAGGAHVLGWDDGEAARTAATAAGITLQSPEGIDWSDIAAVVAAPGVPLTHPAPHPVVDAARAAAVPVIGDIELFLNAGHAARIVGITGTNGKSTTTALVGHLLSAAGRSNRVGGNIGVPVLDLEPLGEDGIYVLELSSFQIDLTPSCHLDVAVLLNVSADHLERHGSMEGYVAVKRRVFARQAAGNHAVIGIDDRWSASIFEDLQAQGHPGLVPIAVGRHLMRGVFVIDGLLHEGPVPVCDLTAATALQGGHNWQNAAAAFAVARALGVSRDVAAAALVSFPGLPHRQEPVGCLDGVRFVNDSKATNGEAAARALCAYERIYWIAGGVPKADGLDAAMPHLQGVRGAFLIGEAARPFAARLAAAGVAAQDCGTLEQALQAAFAAAREGVGHSDRPVVLFSPACASFDQFRDYEARGDRFRALVAGMIAADPDRIGPGQTGSGQTGSGRAGSSRAGSGVCGGAAA